MGSVGGKGGGGSFAGLQRGDQVEPVDAWIDVSELEQAIAEAKVLARQSVAEAVLATITEAGFQPEDILPMLEPQPVQNERKRLRKAAASGKVWPVYALIGDPSRTYSRGPLPGWMKDAMDVAGFDCTNAVHRGQFRDQHMALVA
jgi:hypothetical protein